MNTLARQEPIRSQQSDQSAAFTRPLGTAIALILRCAHYRVLRVASVGAWLQSPLLLKQIHFFYDTLGTPTGYVTWAYLTPEVERRLISDPAFLLHFSEWNEGERLWLIDFVAPNGMVREMVAYMRRNMFSDFREVRYVRRDAAGRVRKVCVWSHAQHTVGRE